MPVIAAMSGDGVETLRVATGTVDIDTGLLPVLQPCSGTNPTVLCLWTVVQSIMWLK